MPRGRDTAESGGVGPPLDGRYARLRQVEMIGPEGLALLQRSRVAVVGVGNIGGHVVAHLSMLGIPALLVDRDAVSEENLGTQGFGGQDVGLPKVEARARMLARLNPSWCVETLRADIARPGLGRLRGTSLILSCSDNVSARVVVNDLSLRMGIPWVDAGVDGSGQTSFTRVAAYGGSPVSACFLCPHDSRSLGQMLRDDSARGCPVWRWDGMGEATAPTLTISAVGAAVAAAQVIWGLKILLGRGHEVAGREMHLDLALPRLTTHALVRNPNCLVDHRTFSFTPVGRPVGAVTVGETLAAAEAEIGEGTALLLHRRSLVTELRCPGCSRVRRPYRALDAMPAEDTRCPCGEAMQPLATGLLDRFQKHEAKEFLTKTWGGLGLPEQDVVTATNDGREIHFLFE